MINEDTAYSGRPYGGVAIIAKQSKGLLYNMLDIDNDRILAISISNSQGKLLQIIVCAYMPYFDKGKPRQTELFIETLDILQGIIDEHASSCPIRLCGDFNVQLPQQAKLQRNWYRKKGFNNHSRIFYDFLVSNNLNVADFMFTQPVAYTYFCHKSKVYTWIDHFIIFSHEESDVENCCIITPDADNTSDHLPISLSLVINKDSVTPESVEGSYKKLKCFPKANWKCRSRNNKFKTLLENKLAGIPLLPDMCQGTTISESKTEEYINQVNDAILSAAGDAGVSSTRVNKPKSYWCPQLSFYRDRKRFWWSLWVNADRPNSGVLYDCYKHAKKVFRRESRRCIRIHVEISYKIIYFV